MRSRLKGEDGTRQQVRHATVAPGVRSRPRRLHMQGWSAAEELAFTGKASGLVRGLSMTDACAVGLLNQGITPSLWTMVA